jgi:hypothetical protein
MKENRIFWISFSMIVIGLTGLWVVGGGRHGYGYHYSMMQGDQMGHGGMFGGSGYPKGINPKNLPDAVSDGAKLFVSYCTQCHALPNPIIHSSADWSPVVDRMEANIRLLGRRTFTESEKKSIVDYLATHSAKP